MEFSKFDIMLLTTMGIGVILISFTFPAVGLADSSNETAESEIPEFNTTSGSLDIVGEFPDSPGSATTGTLEYRENGSFGIVGVDIRVIEGSNSDGLRLQLENDSGNQDINVEIQNTSGGLSVVDSLNVTGEEWTSTYQNKSLQNGWTIQFSAETFDNFGSPDVAADVDFQVIRNGAPTGGGWVSGIPIVGGLFGAGEALMSSVIYIGEVLFWGIGFVFEVAVALLTLLLDSFTFAVQTMHWLLSTYTSTVSAAGTVWAQAVLAIPGLLLMIEFVKIGFISISLLPTT